MQFMSQTFHSPKFVSFFAKCIHSEILALHEILIWHVETIFQLLYIIGIMGQNQAIQEISF